MIPKQLKNTTNNHDDNCLLAHYNPLNSPSNVYTYANVSTRKNTLPHRLFNQLHIYSLAAQLQRGNVDTRAKSAFLSRDPISAIRVRISHDHARGVCYTIDGRLERRRRRASRERNSINREGSALAYVCILCIICVYVCLLFASDFLYLYRGKDLLQNFQASLIARD